MEQFVIPDDGVVVTTADGRPVIDLMVQPEGNVLRLFTADGEPKVVLGTHDDTAVVMLGDPQTTGVGISTRGEITEIAVANSGKTINLAINATRSEIRMVNGEGGVTNNMYVDENGGQLGLGDHGGNLNISTGAGQAGGTFHVMNSRSDSVVVLDSKDDSGNITLLDSAGRIRMMIAHKDDGNIYLVDADGHVVWTTAEIS